MYSKKQNKSARKKNRFYSALESSTPLSTLSGSIPTQTVAHITTTHSAPTTTTTTNTTGPRITVISTSTSATDPSDELNNPPLRYTNSSESHTPRTNVTFDYTSSEGIVLPPNFGVGLQYCQTRIFKPKTGGTYAANKFQKPCGFQSTSQSGHLTSSVFGKIRSGQNNNGPPPPFGLPTTSSQTPKQYVPPFNSQTATQYRPPFNLQTTQSPVARPTQEKSSYQLNPRLGAQSSFPSGPNVTRSFGTIYNEQSTSGPRTEFNTQNVQQPVSENYQPGSSHPFNTVNTAQSGFASTPSSTRIFGNLHNQQSNIGHSNQSNSLHSLRGRGIENQPPQKSAHNQILKSGTYVVSKNKNTTKSSSYANTGLKTNTILRPKTNITYSEAAKQSTNGIQQNTSSVLYINSGTHQATESSTLLSGGHDSTQTTLPKSYSNFSFFTTNPSTSSSKKHSLQQNHVSELNTNVSASNLNNLTTLQSEENVSQRNSITLSDIIFGQQPDYRHVPESKPESNINENNNVYLPIPLAPKINLQFEFDGQSQEGRVPQTGSAFEPNPLNFVTQSNSTFVPNSNGVRSLNETRIPLYPETELDSKSVPSTSGFQTANASASGFQTMNASTNNFQDIPVTTSSFQNSNATQPNSGTGQFGTQSKKLNPCTPPFTGRNQPGSSQPGPNQPGPNQPGPNQPGPSTSNVNVNSGIGTSSGPSVTSLMHGNSLFDDQVDLAHAPQLDLSYDPSRNAFGYPNWSTFDSTSAAETSTAFGPATGGQPGTVPTGNSEIYSICFPCPSVSPYETREIIWKLAQMLKGENLLHAIKMLVTIVNQELAIPFEISCRCATHRTYMQVVPAAYMLDYLLRATSTYRDQGVNVEYVYIQHLQVTMFEDEDRFPLCRVQMYTRVMSTRFPAGLY